MNTTKVAELLTTAKYEFEHGAFNTLKQAEFFEAMAAAIAETPPARKTAPESKPEPKPIPTPMATPKSGS